jgi:flagellar hook assembly protein FlgD
MMKTYILFVVLLLNLVIFSVLFSEPSFNESAPGCAGSGCHSFTAGVVSANSQSNLEVEVTLSGVSQGEKVGGELVDAGGNVVDVIQNTSSNPFILTAPSAGDYTVNAGYKKPQKEWDSVSVAIGVTDISDPNGKIFPEKIALLGNHPNPFNHETIIKFSLPRQNTVELAIFDINGKLIRNLSDNTYTAGIHSVRWDGRDNFGKVVASGIYLVRMNSENQQFSHRVLLSK